MTDWSWWQKALATLAVDIPLVLFLWWLLWKSRWAKPKKFCGECPSCKWSEAYEGERHCTER